MNAPVKIRVQRPVPYGYDGQCIVELFAPLDDGTELKLVKFSCHNDDLQKGISSFNTAGHATFPGKLLEA